MSDLELAIEAVKKLQEAAAKREQYLDAAAESKCQLEKEIEEQHLLVDHIISNKH